MQGTSALSQSPPPFAAFEWLIAWRYLRARRKEGGISVIAWYALIGVMLGVATLIVVQAVMIGFREEFTAAGDDVDVCWRLQAAGRKLCFVPSAVVWHHRRATADHDA